MKKILLFIPILLSTFFVKAQFGPPNDFTNNYTALIEFKICDLDNDGDLDVLSIGSRGAVYSLSWNKNVGQGKFTSQYFISTGVEYKTITTLDTDNDGDIDIIASSNLKGITFYENLGSGTFSSELVINSQTSIGIANCLDKADIDNDGDLDIVAARSSIDKIFWHENLGNNIWSAEKSITTNADGVSSITIFDLDNNGWLDIIASSPNDNKIATYKNLGSGNFNTEVVFSNKPTTKINHGDVDNDGYLDIITASYLDDKVSWYRNIGGGVIDSSQNIISNSQDAPMTIDSGDLDNDGDLDIISASSSDNKIAWYENLGSGVFNSGQIISSTFDGSYVLQLSDLNQDGLLDVITTTNNALLCWIENSGNGVLNDSNKTTIKSRIDNPNSIHIVDIDNDGYLDVICISLFFNNLVWYKNSKNSEFIAQQIISTTLENITSITPEDFNNDGHIDFVTTSAYAQSNNHVVWFKNLGNGIIDTSQKIIDPSIGYSYCSFSSDINNDSKIDLIIGSDEGIFWCENLDGESFGNKQIISNNLATPGSLLTIDIDNDGDMDIFSSSGDISGSNSKITWYENVNGIIDTAEHLISTLTNFPRKILTLDLDNDGDMDLLSSTNNESISWYKNLGGGNFSSKYTIANVYGHGNMYAADINDDGIEDILITSAFDNKVSLYKNLGGGNFDSEEIIFIDDAFAQDISAGDIDNDGDLDVFSSFFEDGPHIDKLVWFENFLYHPTKISGRIFYDINQNGQNDSLDIGFNQIGVYSTPQSDITFTYQDGRYVKIFSDTIGTYIIQPNISPNWNLVTDSSSYTIRIDSNFISLDSLDFGFYPDTIITIMEPTLTGGFPRCDQIVNYWVNIRNEGTTLPNGIVLLQLDDVISYVSSAIAPDSIIGQNLYWHFDSLFFFAEENFNLQVQMPPFTSMGDTLTSILTVHEIDGSNNIVYTNSDTLKQVSVCAYDPNDKAVLPKGIGQQGYIANEQELEYLIRFQNTGNDTALTVMVRDQLDENLDWSSLHPIASSHPVQIWIEQDGESVFKFENIMLPDSNVDFLGSQGFVKFSINPKPNLAPNTPIFNTGHIYFDSNPAVITNTVLNTIEDTTSFPVAVQEIAFTETNEIIIFPNPFTESLTVYYKTQLNSNYNITLYDISGKVALKKENISNNKSTFDVSQLKNGIYILVGTDNAGKKLFSQQVIAQ